MTRLAALLPLCASLLLAPAEAEAQFANRSVSLSVGFMDLNDTALGLSIGFPTLGLSYSGYIESGFEWTVGVQGMILRDITGRQVPAVAGGGGGRYLFLEERIRPYLGAELTYVQVFNFEAVSRLFGVGPYAGLDYFATDSFSIGPRAQFNLYLMLNTPVQTAITGSLVASAWF